MVSEKLFNKLNDQVNFEFYSAYIYLSMSAYAESIDLSGFANFFRVQAQEEQFHAMKFYDYIFQKDGVVELEAIARPDMKFENMVDVFQKAYGHEKIVTNRIYAMADIANEEKEHSTTSLLNWFIDEQVEEENNFKSLLKKVKRSESNMAALYMMDDELAAKVYTPPIIL